MGYGPIRIRISLHLHRLYISFFFFERKFVFDLMVEKEEEERKRAKFGRKLIWKINQVSCPPVFSIEFSVRIYVYRMDRVIFRSQLFVPCSFNPEIN